MEVSLTSEAKIWTGNAARVFCRDAVAGSGAVSGFARLRKIALRVLKENSFVMTSTGANAPKTMFPTFGAPATGNAASGKRWPRNPGAVSQE
jgi:hypothetical protein